MKTATLINLFNSINLDGINGMTIETLTILNDSGLTDLNARPGVIASACESVDLPNTAAAPAITISREVEKYGVSDTLISWNGETGNLIITESTIKFNPLRPSINWGEAY